MLTYILLGLGALVLILLGVVAMQPSDFRIARAATISAPPSVVYNNVSDFHNWAKWSPWEKLDPNMKKTFEGPSAGTGSSYAWSGNDKAGQGKMTIIESRPNELTRIKLEFLKPFKATNTAEFTFKPVGGQTAVNWSMTGHKNFMFKAVGLLMNMDKTVGGDFERGLEGLRQVAESEA
jgi:uncharacterized protein YndB with AHSA1/START domain